MHFHSKNTNFMTTEQRKPMSKVTKEKPQIIDESGDKYKYGFVTAIEADTAPKGLNEDIIRLISAKKANPNGCWNGA